MPPTTTAVALRHYPAGVPDPDDLELTELPLPALEPDEILVRVTHLSLDPYLRSFMGAGHLESPPLPLGSVLPSRSVAQVTTSRHGNIPVGSWVLAETGLRAHAVLNGNTASLLRLPVGVPRTAALGALGMPGLTAYAALERHLTPTAGETVVISSATGGVGATAGQLARDRGARTVAIVGSDTKAHDATHRLRYDVAVVRGVEGWERELAAACPNGVDAYLHMGDMPTLLAVMSRLALGARVSLCGLMDQVNGGPVTMLRAGAIMNARASVHGMVVHDHVDLQAKAIAEIAPLLAAGKFTLHEERHQGLAEAPAAFARLMAGANRGKVIVDLTGAHEDAVLSHQPPPLDATADRHE